MAGPMCEYWKRNPASWLRAGTTLCPSSTTAAPPPSRACKGFQDFRVQKGMCLGTTALTLHACSLRYACPTVSPRLGTPRLS